MVHRGRGNAIDGYMRASQGRRRGRLCDRAIVRGLDFDHGSCRGGGRCRVVLHWRGNTFRVVKRVLRQAVILFKCLLVICVNALSIMQHARVVHRDIDRARGCYMRSDVRAHPPDSSLDAYALKVIGAHTDKAFPRARLAKHLIVRERSEIRSKAGNCRVRGV